MLILYSNSKLKTNYFMVILFSLSFSVALGSISEILKYYSKLFFDREVTLADYTYAMTSLTLVAIGALVAATIGYIYMKWYKIEIIKMLAAKFKKRNPNLFILKTDSPEELLRLIEKGENEKLEFKSSLRTNLHTGEFDKNMECSVIKTINAFLNTEGGALLIGI